MSRLLLCEALPSKWSKPLDYSTDLQENLLGSPGREINAAWTSLTGATRLPPGVYGTTAALTQTLVRQSGYPKGQDPNKTLNC